VSFYIFAVVSVKYPFICDMMPCQMVMSKKKSWMFQLLKMRPLCTLKMTNQSYPRRMDISGVAQFVSCCFGLFDFQFDMYINAMISCLSLKVINKCTNYWKLISSIGRIGLLEKEVSETVKKQLTSPWLPRYCRRRGIRWHDDGTWSREGCGHQQPFISCNLDVPKTAKSKELSQGTYSLYKQTNSWIVFIHFTESKKFTFHTVWSLNFYVSFNNL